MGEGERQRERGKERGGSVNLVLARANVGQRLEPPDRCELVPRKVLC